MDLSTRLLLVVIFGSGLGYIAGNFIFGQPFLGATTGAIFAIATDTTLRTMKNVKINPRAIARQIRTKQIKKYKNVSEIQKISQKDPKIFDF